MYRFSLAAVLALAFGARVTQAQSLYAFDPTLTVTELTGPPAPPCGDPLGPVNSAFLALPGACPGAFAFAPPLGDIAVDPVTDTIYVTSGGIIVEYSRAGANLGFVIPPVAGLTGLAIGAPGMLWITDGFMYGAIPTAPFGCPGGLVPFVVGPFPVPIGPIFAGPIGDLDFEGATGSLIACDAAGTIGSFFPGPLSPVGPYGFFVLPAAGCLGPGLMGIAFDKTLPGTGTFFATDGAMILRALPGGFPAPPTFAFPFPCFPAATFGPVVGLAFAGRQIPYGAGADSIGLPVPSIGSVGQSYVGNPAFIVTLTGSLPTSKAILRMSFAPACPRTPLLGLPNLLGSALFGASGLSGAATVPFFTKTVVGPGGTATYATPIPPTIAPGTSVYLQWLVKTPFSLQVTGGGALTTMLP
jgi:hypothetical protein